MSKTIIIEDLISAGPIPFDNAKGAVVQIDGKYYLKDSGKVVRIGDSYFLKDSDQIVMTYNGSFCEKKDSILMFDGNIASINSAGLATFEDGSYGIFGFNSSKRLNGKNFQIKKPYAVNFMGKYYHVDDCVLAASIYKGFRYIPKGAEVQCVISKSNYLQKDCIKIKDDATGEQVFVSKQYIPKANIKAVITSVSKDPTTFFNISFDIRMNCNGYVWSKILDGFVKSEKKKELEDLLISYIKESGLKRSTTLIKKRISERYGSIDNIPQINEEKLADEIRVIHGDIRGGTVYLRRHEAFSRKMFSQSHLLTGGLDYTFGIEHETVAGVVPNHVCTQFSLEKVGDGSTRFPSALRDTVEHYEYVSPPLHGDLGIGMIKKYLPIIRKHTLSSDKCSAHIHVGGQRVGNDYTDTPYFNREFSAYAINLGCQIEESLARLMPEFRNPKENEYCHSLTGFSCKDFSVEDFSGMPIKTREDRNSIIARYVFSRETLDRTRNKRTQLKKWHNIQRKKWLNLVNCNSQNGQDRHNSFETIEFRLFPATTDSDTMHFYVLISLAFVWFVENRKKLIEKGGLTIDNVLDEAYKDKKIYKFVSKMVKKFQTK